MSISYSWAITQMAVTDGQVVRDVTFRRTATEGEQSATIEGAVTVPPANPENFIPYPDLTEAVVAGWVAAVVDADQLDADLAAMLAPQPAGPVVEPLPWANAN